MKKILATVLLSLGLAQTALAEGGREQLNKFFTTVNTMQSQFTQEVRDANGKLRQKSSGRVFLSRPGRFSWEYSAPEKHRIVADGRNVWVYDVELDQVTVKPMRHALSAAPVGLLLSKKPVESQFRVQPLKSNGSLEWFRLTPHKKDSDFTVMDLGVGKQGLQQMVLEDKFGQQTTIYFRGMGVNRPIPANRFQFKPPAGVDVIGRPS